MTTVCVSDAVYAAGAFDSCVYYIFISRFHHNQPYSGQEFLFTVRKLLYFEFN